MDPLIPGSCLHRVSRRVIGLKIPNRAVRGIRPAAFPVTLVGHMC